MKPPNGTWIVELQPGFWLAEWSGDPGRTLLKTSARKFATQCGAFRAIAHASKFRDMRGARVEKLEESP